MAIRLIAFLLSVCWADTLRLGSGQAGGGPYGVVGGAVEWRLDNLERIGGHPITVVGAPHVVTTTAGNAVEFNGSTDGLFLDVNPLAGLEQFTIEAVLEPAADGPAEQRFFHIEEAGATETRALMETRMLPGGLWSLDTHLPP